jgi:hypothetical protein
MSIVTGYPVYFLQGCETDINIMFTEHFLHLVPSCNNVAPVTNLCLGRATTRSHSSQWSKQKVAVET